MRHFLFFTRSIDHCTLHHVRAVTLKDAFAKFVLADSSRSRLKADGTIVTPDSYGGEIVYTHPLEAFECQYKSGDGEYGNYIEVKEVSDRQLTSDFSEIFCSDDPQDVEAWIKHARQRFRQDYPRLRARAFLWRLNKGTLITFHRRRNPRKRWPIEVIVRYQFQSWGASPSVCELSLDEITAQIKVSATHG